jgi:hypothetical protein
MRLAARIATLAAGCLMAAGDASAILLYRVSGITDLNLPTWNMGNPGITASIDLCAHTSVAGPYSVSVSSVGGYVLKNGAQSIAYALRWEDSGAGNLGSSSGVANGVALSNRQHANSSLLASDCSVGSPAGPTARLYLDIPQATMNAALAGTYSGTLVILIGP